MSSVEEEYKSRTKRSAELFERARNAMPGGVNHNIRAFKPYPFCVVSADGNVLIDADGNRYVDYWNGHGALILGHNYPPVVKAVKEQVERSSHYGTFNECEILLAEQIGRMLPSAEMVRFTNSGTEAAMYALRLARAYTGRAKVGKFEGGWHGGFNDVHVGTKPPFERLPSAGLPKSELRNTVLLPYNDLNGVKRRVRGERLACILVEPMLGQGCVPAERGFLEGLKELCERSGSLLIFDEVITGFRLSKGGAQEYLKVKPDLTVLGKIIGGGHPIGAIAGPREVMQRMDPWKYQPHQLAYQGGTFCGNPVTMRAGLETLKVLEDKAVYDHINGLGARARRGISEAFEGKGVTVTGLGSTFYVHFKAGEVRNAKDVFKGDMDALWRYGLFLINRGIFGLPTHFNNISYVHTQEDITKLIEVTRLFAETVKTR
ncbi:MAG: glutamate-1-semialdehyde 2,1-aminomutase [Candidatus Brockarchaeota archaeon]|nr:glutamate-1-semialdehyde 2,1-aminomutase [Candidatus Brockarchaeota archaeon]